MRIVFYANSKVAIPVFQYLMMNRWVAGLCMAESDFEGKNQFQQMAQWSQIPILEVNAKNMDRVSPGWLKLIQPDLGIVFTFPYKISQLILESTENGFFNIHFGKLPDYRGSEPLFWNMINQEKDVVISIHKMTQDFDAGPIALEQKVSLGENDTYGGMQRKLSQNAVSAVNLFLGNLLKGNLKLINQLRINIKPRSKPHYKDVRINWEEHSAQFINAVIKAVNPWNKGAITYSDGNMVKILLGSVGEGEILENKKPGEFWWDESLEKMRVATVKGILTIYALYGEDGYINPKHFFEQSQSKTFLTEVSIPA